MNITKDFVIGILTYIKYDHLDEFLEDISSQSIWPKEIIISDNGGSYTLKKKYNIPITIIKNAYNYGTMRGMNQIIKLANKSNTLFVSDDLYFINNTSLEKIYNTFIYENTVNKNHLIICSNWASFFASSEWIDTFGLFDDKLWPCYYDDSDICERIRKHPKNSILNSIFSYPLKLNSNNTYLNNNGSSESEVMGNKHATCSTIINNIYNDMISRTSFYFMEKWKSTDTLTETDILNIHDNTKDRYVDVNEIDFKDNHLNFLRGKVKNYTVRNPENNISSFIDDILNLKKFEFNKIIEYNSQKVYISQALLHNNPKELLFYCNEYTFHHEFCRHINYIMNYNVTIKVLPIENINHNCCDLLAFNLLSNKEKYDDIIKIIDAKYILIISSEEITKLDMFISIDKIFKNNNYMQLFKKIEQI